MRPEQLLNCCYTSSNWIKTSKATPREMMEKINGSLQQHHFILLKYDFCAKISAFWQVHTAALRKRAWKQGEKKAARFFWQKRKPPKERMMKRRTFGGFCTNYKYWTSIYIYTQNCSMTIWAWIFHDLSGSAPKNVLSFSAHCAHILSTHTQTISHIIIDFSDVDPKISNFFQLRTLKNRCKGMVHERISCPS